MREEPAGPHPGDGPGPNTTRAVAMTGARLDRPEIGDIHADCRAEIERLLALRCGECGEDIHETDGAPVFHQACVDPQLARLRAALEQIERESGQVCPEFETCSHGPCQGSLAAKLIALEALGQHKQG